MRHLHADADADAVAVADAEHADGSVEANLRLPHEWECVKVTATWGRPGQRWRCFPNRGNKGTSRDNIKDNFRQLFVHKQPPQVRGHD